MKTVFGCACVFRMEWEQRRYEEEMMEYHRQMNPNPPVYGMKMVSSTLFHQVLMSFRIIMHILDVCVC